MNSKIVILHPPEFEQLSQLLGQARQLVSNAQPFDGQSSNDRAMPEVDPLEFDGVQVVKADA